jgi:hypothetical protein
VTQSRIADHDASELGRPRPRAADDFAAIRARMEELRREQAQIEKEADFETGPRPHVTGSRPLPANAPQRWASRGR